MKRLCIYFVCERTALAAAAGGISTVMPRIHIYIYIFLHPFRAPEHVSPFGAVSPTRAGIQTPDAEMQSLGAEMQTLGAEMQTLGAVMQTLGAETQTLVLRCSHRC